MKKFPYHLSEEQRNRFIGGRRRYNTQRYYEAIDRRWRMLFYWREHPSLCKADLARHFKVSRATITRDLQAIKREHWRYRDCPVCGGRLDVGPDIATETEVFSDLKRHLPSVFGGLGIGNRY